MVNTANKAKSVERDEFSGDMFLDKTAQPPSVIVLNDQREYGYFIPESTMVKCGWLEVEGIQLVEHTFRSGATEKGLLIKEPRMLVCPKTDLYQYDANASNEKQTKVVLGWYNAEYKNDPNVKTERVYLVFFLDENNQPLHSAPLRYAARGANGASFEQIRRTFKSELESCHARENGEAARPKNDVFHCLGVFSFSTKPELAGDKQRAWACRVVGHESPTLENWKEYFVGYSDLKESIWGAFEPGKKFNVFRDALPDEDSASANGSNAYGQASPEEEEIARASLHADMATANRSESFYTGDPDSIPF